MQAVYPSRIDWEDEPSTNTPLGANNLNKMDYALYELDKRVLTLGGYEERAALSATNAKTSENNAKASENNAKTSEANAKGYMEKAFAGTPEGYAQLVEDVSLLDIATTTESTLSKSKSGGLRFNHIKGATLQNGTPTPSSPIGIKNVGDCVEMIQGGYDTSNGVYVYNVANVCYANTIPCKPNDVIKLDLEKALYPIVLFCNDNTFISHSTSGSNKVDEYSVTVPSGVNNFTFYINEPNGLTLDTVGKISLTVNGKYVTPIKSHGKNLIENKATTQTINGVTFTVNKDKSVTVNGTATDNIKFSLSGGFVTLDKLGLKVGESYILSHATHEVFKEVYFYLSSGNSLNFPNYETEMTAQFTPTIESATYDTTIYIASGKVCNNLTFYPMIRKADITDDTYEPYQESTAYIYTDEPIRDSDVVFNDNGVWKVERNKCGVTFNGTENWETWVSPQSPYVWFRVLADNCLNGRGTILCNRLSSVDGNFSSNNCYFVSPYLYLCIDESYLTDRKVDAWKTWLTSNHVEVEYPLDASTYETLDTASQIALNSLETFDTVTYINVDSRVQPSEIEVEYGTSKVGGYSLEALRNSKNNEKAIEENMKAITSGEVVVEYESEDDFAGRSWINVVTLMAGEKLKNILNMISAMFNNIRFLRNEVNKKMDANYGYLTEGDLNNIIYESGKAYCTTNVANIPIMGRGWLEVLMSDDADMVLQRYTTAVGNKVFIRRLVKSTSNGWGEWSKCNLTSDDIVVDMVAKPATMNLPAWASVSIEIESKYLSLEYELLSANVYFVDDLSSGTLSDSNLCVDQVMTSTNTASAHCCVAKVRNASSSQINKGCYSVARFVLVKK